LLTLTSNIEVAFARRASQQPTEGLLARLDWLDKHLEALLTLPRADTVKFVPARAPVEKPLPAILRNLDTANTAASTAQTTSTPSEHPRRTFELQQIQRRFRSTIQCQHTDDIAQVYTIPITPTDPDYAHPYPTILIHITVPRTYPDKPVSIRIDPSSVPRPKAR
jgi:hypothetical protein